MVVKVTGDGNGELQQVQVQVQALALRVLWLCHPPSSDHLTTPKLRRGFALLHLRIAPRGSPLLDSFFFLEQFVHHSNMLKSTYTSLPLPPGWTEHRAPAGWCTSFG